MLKSVPADNTWEIQEKWIIMSNYSVAFILWLHNTLVIPRMAQYIKFLHTYSTRLLFNSFFSFFTIVIIPLIISLIFNNHCYKYWIYFWKSCTKHHKLKFNIYTPMVKKYPTYSHFQSLYLYQLHLSVFFSLIEQSLYGGNEFTSVTISPVIEPHTVCSYGSNHSINRQACLVSILDNWIHIISSKFFYQIILSIISLLYKVYILPKVKILQKINKPDYDICRINVITLLNILFITISVQPLLSLIIIFCLIVKLIFFDVIINHLGYKKISSFFVFFFWMKRISSQTNRKRKNYFFFRKKNTDLKMIMYRSY